jgi:HK97 gp10 family phage protein
MARRTSFNAKLIAQLNAIKDVGGVAAWPAAKVIAERAKDLAPVDTGYMRDHIRARKHGQLGAVVESTAPYSGFVEYGTRYMAAQPFLRPAVDQGQREILQAAAAALQAEMKKRIRR